MAAITFDTHKFVKTLEASGIPESQAEALSSAMQEAHNAADVATKADIRELELRIDSRFERVYGEMRLMKWMLGILVGGVTALILKAFF